jgi:hypothetical protein
MLAPQSAAPATMVAVTSFSSDGMSSWFALSHASASATDHAELGAADAEYEPSV